MIVFTFKFSFISLDIPFTSTIVLNVFNHSDCLCSQFNSVSINNTQSKSILFQRGKCCLIWFGMFHLVVQNVSECYMLICTPCVATSTSRALIIDL